MAAFLNESSELKETKVDGKSVWKSEEFKQIERQMQEQWKQRGTYARDADLTNTDKFMATFPYPYMNGFLHLGHGFTMSKYDFACRFYHSMGYDVLEPFSFHLTGMPIMVAADKLREDIKLVDQGLDSNELPDTSQYMIMKMMGIDDSEIRKFIDAKYWGRYFPEKAKQTLERFGIGYDPRRSFITTDANPIYDKFVKWQFSELYKKHALRFGTRYDMYSIKDSQPCLGHERSSGEDAVPQKSYLVRFVLKSLSPPTQSLLPSTSQSISFKNVDSMNESTPVYLIASMSRPETLYGATNIWIDKNGSYGVFYVETSFSKGYWICQEINLISLIYQNRETDRFHIIKYTEKGSITGSELIGMKVINPLNQLSLVIASLNYQSVDPSLKIDMSRGTGIVVSVPSESPIDYLGYCCNSASTTIQEHLITTPITPIIKVLHSDYTGTMMAPDLINKIKTDGTNNFPSISQKDLHRIREFCDVDSINSSVMIVGSYATKTIIEARNEIVASATTGDVGSVGGVGGVGGVDGVGGVGGVGGIDIIIPYYEPDQEAYSRSGDRLIVAKMDQWFIDYGDAKWKELTRNHIDIMHFTDETVKNGLLSAIEWLDQWPCSRTYGLGSSFPEDIVGEDSGYIIDSLSDSTIYMALYTIYHLFERYKIDASELTNDVFDYIFLLKYYDDSRFEKFKPFREEFIHWYPMDLRVSAKDLINNHLAMCIFNHVMIWDREFMEQRYAIYYPDRYEKVKSFGPVSYEVNGYISSRSKHGDIEKMSKSKGNFKTLDQAIDMYTTDSIRFTFASASTGVDDSYFDQELCSRMIEKLFNEKTWIVEKLKELSKNVGTNTDKRKEMNFIDTMIMNEMLLICHDVIKAYQKNDFREVVTKGFHIFQGLRDTYVLMNSKNLDDMNHNVLKTFIKAQLMMMVPIIPHFCAFFDDMQMFHNVMGTYKDTMGFSLKMTDLISSFSIEGFNHVDPVKHWQHVYLTDIAACIAKRVLKLRCKTSPVKKVIIFTAGEVTDPVEKLAVQLFQLIGHDTVPTKEIIDQAKVLDQILMNNDKNVGTLIRYYRRFQDFVQSYGRDMLNMMITGTNIEYNTLNDNLMYYLRLNASDTYSIEIINHTSKSDVGVGSVSSGVSINSDKISGVRLNDPVIRYE